MYNLLSFGFAGNFSDFLTEQSYLSSIEKIKILLAHVQAHVNT